MQGPKQQTFCGVTFTRNDKTGYYYSSSARTRMHRYVWEHYNGPIPEGYQIHHKDGDRSNNTIENLELLQRGEHQRLHGEMLTDDEREWRRKNLDEKARPKAIEWHKSEAGKEWHSRHGKEVMQNREPTMRICQHCGKPYETIQYGTSKFCSNACKSAARRARGDDLEDRTCEMCGGLFSVNKYSKTTTCSRACSNRKMHKEKGHTLTREIECTCAVCGGQFKVMARHAKATCSRVCAIKYGRMKKTETA